LLIFGFILIIIIHKNICLFLLIFFIGRRINLVVLISILWVILLVLFFNKGLLESFLLLSFQSSQFFFFLLFLFDFVNFALNHCNIKILELAYFILVLYFQDNTCLIILPYFLLNFSLWYHFYLYFIVLLNELNLFAIISNRPTWIHRLIKLIFSKCK
jgi:hypothetical protein